MPRKAGFTRKDYNKFINFRAQGYTAQRIAGALNVCQANVEAAIANLEAKLAPKEPELTPAQKGAATRAKKKAEAEEETNEEVPQDVNPEDTGKHPNFL